ncbi:hypothetical protein IEQ34_010699 [Dendrobium chrysotoxum]|uniref:Aconitase/3-isopropylmalate dehydratase large subunit alpha/beta/alpha domain-containing protein n=1 Tax=Dendrobium chrysotoxum TaxID=161865 RepID=A0AAV7GTH6_DENCH|nr:hypothetical protein IEQ34_010699 [Dendrobium chrysotoxum]
MAASPLTATGSAIFSKKCELGGSISSSSPSLVAHRCRKHSLNKILAVMAPSRTPQRPPSTTGSVKHAMTMTEKILARASERSQLEPGENVWVNVDVLMTHDVCGPGTIGIFKREFGENAKDLLGLLDLGFAGFRVLWAAAAVGMVECGFSFPLAAFSFSPLLPPRFLLLTPWFWWFLLFPHMFCWASCACCLGCWFASSVPSHLAGSVDLPVGLLVPAALVADLPLRFLPSWLFHALYGWFAVDFCSISGAEIMAVVWKACELLLPSSRLLTPSSLRKFHSTCILLLVPVGVSLGLFFEDLLGLLDLGFAGFGVLWAAAAVGMMECGFSFPLAAFSFSPLLPPRFLLLTPWFWWFLLFPHMFCWASCACCLGCWFASSVPSHLAGSVDLPVGLLVPAALVADLPLRFLPSWLFRALYDWFAVDFCSVSGVEIMAAVWKACELLLPSSRLLTPSSLRKFHSTCILLLVPVGVSLGLFFEVWDREKIVIIPDHYIFTSDERANRNVDILRDFCLEQNIKYFYDIKDLGNFKANPDYKGVCHVALAQEGHCRPGEVLLGTDSHTCNAGAFGQFSSGIGNTDAGFVMGTGKLLLKVPPTLRFILDGEMPSYLLAKDLILQIIGEITVAGATYKSMEFLGSTVESLSMEERMTLCNMVVEAGGKNGVVPADKTTFKYLEDKTSVEYQPVYSDENARFIQDYKFDVSKLEPLVAKPHSPDNRALARECKDVKIDRVYIGSCTGGKTEDFMAAAKVFLASGKKVKVPTFLVPATQKVWMDLYGLPVPGSGGKTCSQIFEEAGCDTPTSPSCGACLGGPRDTYARMNEPQASSNYPLFFFAESVDIQPCLCFDHQQEFSWQNGAQRRSNLLSFAIYGGCISIDRLCNRSKRVLAVKEWVHYSHRSSVDHHLDWIVRWAMLSVNDRTIYAQSTIQSIVRREGI